MLHSSPARVRARTLFPRLISLATALPPFEVRQGEAKRWAASMFGSLSAVDRRLLEVFDHPGLGKRRISMPLEWLTRDHDFGEMNDRYLETALELSEAAARRALGGAGLVPRDVDHIVFVSSTGLACPSLDASLAGRMGFRADVLRTPIWGLGCAGGVAGLARAALLARAQPASRVLIVALELCSLTFQRRDADRRNLVAASLFSDGAAAAVIRGVEAPDREEPSARSGDPFSALDLVDSGSVLWPGTLDIMGWRIDGSGLHVVFSRSIPDLVEKHLRPAVEEFLARHDLGIQDVRRWIAHPGGPKVLSAMGRALGLPPGSLGASAGVLKALGNMSSPTALFVLQRSMAEREIPAGEPALLLALGPGFSAELLLARGAPRDGQPRPRAGAARA